MCTRVSKSLKYKNSHPCQCSREASAERCQSTFRSIIKCLVELLYSISRHVALDIQTSAEGEPCNQHELDLSIYYMSLSKFLILSKFALMINSRHLKEFKASPDLKLTLTLTLILTLIQTLYPNLITLTLTRTQNNTLTLIRNYTLIQNRIHSPARPASFIGN